MLWITVRSINDSSPSLTIKANILNCVCQELTKPILLTFITGVGTQTAMVEVTRGQPSKPVLVQQLHGKNTSVSHYSFISLLSELYHLLVVFS